LRPCGAYVADALAKRLAGQEVRCEVIKLDQYDRVARCEADGEGLSQWLVASGLAMVFRRYSDRFTAEGSVTDLAEQEGITDAYVCRLLPLPGAKTLWKRSWTGDSRRG
jgi:endonuclease YncB( thermonuclease family)